MKEPPNYTYIPREIATVGDFIVYAKLMASRAETAEEMLEAARMLEAAEDSETRANGDRSLLLREVIDSALG
jgi:hypothetical protein